jgi:CubicO group peptidase (beta-lactamase class C family)
VSDVRGYVRPGFEAVADAMAAAVATGGEVGLAAAGFVAGEKAFDIWCGDADPASALAWSADTLAVVYSCTKGATALCAHLLADRGLLDVEAPVTEYWPEFSAPGAKVRHILNHTVGLVTFPRYWDLVSADGRGLERAEEIEARLAASAPAWPPGTGMGYHALTYGWLVDGLVRRIDGRSVGRFFAEEVAGPLGLSLWIGLPPSEHHRVAPVIPAEPLADPAAQAEYDRLVAEARERLRNEDYSTIEAQWVGSFLMPPEVDEPGRFLVDIMNTPWVRSAEVPGGNGIGTADALARMYAPLSVGGTFDGLRLVSPESIAQFSTPQPTDDGTPTGYCLGYAQFTPELLAAGPTPASFGHAGAGGALGFADPGPGVAFGIVKNKMQSDTATAERLIAALYRSLEAAG